MGALYQLQFPNGKSYIGITSVSAEARFREHVVESKGRKGWAIHRALAKHGADTVRVVTLAIADSWDYLQLIEKRAIRVFESFGPKGYNMTAGGDGFLGGRHTAESKAKIAEAGRNCSAETRKKIGDAFRGKPGSNRGSKHSQDACTEKAMRQLQKGTAQQGNTSGCAGVSWSKVCKKWQARYKHRGVIKHLGVFSTLEDAIAARTAAVESLLKERA